MELFGFVEDNFSKTRLKMKKKSCSLVWNCLNFSVKVCFEWEDFFKTDNVILCNLCKN